MLLKELTFKGGRGLQRNVYLCNFVCYFTSKCVKVPSVVSAPCLDTKSPPAVSKTFAAIAAFVATGASFIYRYTYRSLN
jgi:hypothetical protein